MICLVHIYLSIVGSIFMDAKSTAVSYFVKYTCKNFAGSVLVKVRHTKQEKTVFRAKGYHGVFSIGNFVSP